MSRSRGPARIIRWRNSWYLEFTDHFTGKQRRLACEGLKAHNAEERRELELQYRSRELLDSADVLKLGGRVAFGAPLLRSLDEYLENVTQREEARKSNPHARAGLSEWAAYAYRTTIGWLKAWLVKKGKTHLTTSELDAPTLSAFFDSIACERGKAGVRNVVRSAATINHHKRSVRTCLGYINALRPKRFPDFESLLTAMKPLRGAILPRATFAPEALVAFVKTAIDHDNPGRVLTISRTKGGRVEHFNQAVSLTAVTPVSRLGVLLALTGMRLDEALNLKWEHVNLDRGRITIYSKKTGMIRILPLVNAPEGDVAPRFLEVLRRWKLEAGNRTYVLPHEDSHAPIFPKTAWGCVVLDAELQKTRVGPKALRQNFTSYAASIGIPAAVAAMWQGHSAVVAERFYRSQVLDRNPGKSIEEAMGLGEVLKDWLGKKSEAVEPPRLSIAVGA